MTQQKYKYIIETAHLLLETKNKVIQGFIQTALMSIF